MQASGYGAYQRIRTQTSSPAELVMLLYDGLQTDLSGAEEGLLKGDHALVNARLVRAQEIVLELIASLDYSYGELPKQLGALYDYVYKRLVHANIHKDIAAVREVSRLLKPIVDAWAQAALSARAAGPSENMGRRL